MINAILTGLSKVLETLDSDRLEACLLINILAIQAIHLSVLNWTSQLRPSDPDFVENHGSGLPQTPSRNQKPNGLQGG